MKWFLRAIIIMLIAAATFVGSKYYCAFRSHEFVSEYGGFVARSDLKTPVKYVADSFELYKFLRNDGSMRLYRTTAIEPLEIFSQAASYEYRPGIRRSPADWREQLKQKCIREYLPTLPVVLEEGDVKLFFFNQYRDLDLEIHGSLNGEIFALNIRNDPRMAASGEVWGHPVWSNRSGDASDHRWKVIWSLVDRNREDLIKIWDRDREIFRKKFDHRYDDLF